MLNPVTMRFRTDGRHIAQAKAHGRPRVENGGSFEWGTADEWDATPPAEPGDTWRVRWYGAPDSIAGYDIFCPKCKHVHGWTTARNCGTRRVVNEIATCAHIQARTSCWHWSGSAEANLLTASPSLHCDTSLGGCGWHGFLTNGVLKHI